MNFPDLIENMLYENFSFIRKFIHFLFLLHDNCIFMPITLSEIFPWKSSILSVILCNPQFYHTCVRWKSSVLSENVSTSFQLYSNCICIPIIVSEIFLRKSSILLVILCNPQFFHTFVENLQFYDKMSNLTFSIVF